MGSACGGSKQRVHLKDNIFEQDLTSKSGKPIKGITLAPNADGQYISRKNPRKSKSKSPARTRNTYVDADTSRLNMSTTGDRYLDLISKR